MDPDNIDELVKRFEERNKGIEHKSDDDPEQTEEDDNPLKDYLLYKDMPVAVGKFEGSDYIFCVIEEGFVSYPLYYGEFTEKSSIEEAGHSLKVGMNKVYMALDLMEGVYMDCKFFYPLKKSKETDKKLYDMYVNIIESLRMSESGIVQATNQDLININREC